MSDGCPDCARGRVRAAYPTGAGWRAACWRHKTTWELGAEAPPGVPLVDPPRGYRDLDQERAIREAGFEQLVVAAPGRVIWRHPEFGHRSFSSGQAAELIEEEAA